MPRIAVANKETIKEATSLLQSGEIIVLPTETVYGLGADARNNDAVAKIFKAKNRPAINPLIVHVIDKNAASALVDMNEQANKVADAFWPGALTLILPAQENNGISPHVTANLKTLAIRVPSHKIMRDVLKQANLPIAAPSANNSGEPSATTPAHAAQSLGDNAPFILAAGSCDVGLESTILDLSDGTPTILRHGAITQEDLENVLGTMRVDVTPSSKETIKSPIKSPGQLLKHYAPNIPVRLNAIDVNDGEALLAFGSTKFMGLKSGGSVNDLPDTAFKNLSEDGDLEQAAQNLFMMLRDLDRPEHKAIAIMNIPEKSIGIAINERLNRAAHS